MIVDNFSSILDKIMDNTWVFVIAIIAFIVIMHFVTSFFAKKLLHSSFFKGEGMQQNGFKTIGFIKSYEQTGTYLNEQPKIRFMVDVLNEYHEIFHAEFSQYIPLTELHQLQIGMTIPVVYDRENPKKMAFDSSPNQEELEDLIDRYLSKQPGNTLSYEERVELREKGQKSLALVKNVDLTGRSLHGKEEAKVTVEITTPSQNKVEATRTFLYTREQLKQIQVGQFIDITYIPGNENKFSINFEVNKNNFEVSQV